jgi:hypothetical protein
VGGWEGLGLGTLGGLLAEFLGLLRLRKQHPSKWPKYMRYWTYWVITIGKMVSGGILVLLYAHSGAVLTWILAVNIGATAPLAIQGLARQAPLEPRAN